MENFKLKGKTFSSLFLANQENSSFEDDFIPDSYSFIEEEIKRSDPEFAFLYEMPYPFGFKDQSSYWHELVLKYKETKTQLIHDIPKAIELLFKQLEDLEKDDSISIDESFLNEAFFIIEHLRRIV